MYVNAKTAKSSKPCTYRNEYIHVCNHLFIDTNAMVGTLMSPLISPGWYMSHAQWAITSSNRITSSVVVYHNRKCACTSGSLICSKGLWNCLGTGGNIWTWSHVSMRFSLGRGLRRCVNILVIRPNDSLPVDCELNIITLFFMLARSEENVTSFFSTWVWSIARAGHGEWPTIQSLEYEHHKSGGTHTQLLDFWRFNVSIKRLNILLSSCSSLEFDCFFATGGFGSINTFIRSVYGFSDSGTLWSCKSVVRFAARQNFLTKVISSSPNLTRWYVQSGQHRSKSIGKREI